MRQNFISLETSFAALHERLPDGRGESASLELPSASKRLAKRLLQGDTLDQSGKTVTVCSRNSATSNLLDSAEECLIY